MLHQNFDRLPGDDPFQMHSFGRVDVADAFYFATRHIYRLPLSMQPRILWCFVHAHRWRLYRTMHGRAFLSTGCLRSNTMPREHIHANHGRISLH